MPTVDNIGDSTLVVPHADIVESNETNTERLAQNKTVLVNIIEVLANSVPHWDENMQYSPIEYTQLLIDLLALPEAAELIGEITQEQIDELKTLLNSTAGAGLVKTTEGISVQSTLDNLEDTKVSYTALASTGISSGALFVGYRFTDVYTALSRMQTLSDHGALTTYLGYNPTVDPQVYADQEAIEDNNLLINGNISVARRFRGIRRNATGISVRGGRKTADALSTGDFDPQVSAVTSARGLAGYNSADGVSMYVDSTLPSYEAWEDVATADYTTNTVSLSGDTYSKINVGDIIRTKHTPRCWGIVVSKSEGIVSVDEWAISSTDTTTPTNGVGLYINPLDKVWAHNANILIPAGTRGSTASGFELGIQNNGIATPTSLNGFDCVLLDGLYGATAAYYAHSAVAGHTWAYGFNAAGCNFNFSSRSGGTVQPYAGFYESSNALVGFKFRNTNVYSMLWSMSSDATDLSLPNSQAIIDPIGRILRQPHAIANITNDVTLITTVPYNIIATDGITITMPPKVNYIAGHEHVLFIANAGTYHIKAFNDETPVSGFTNYTLTTTKPRQKISILFNGSTWEVYE